MNGWRKAVGALVVAMATPALAVESMYLDTVPVRNPGEYLAPADLYFQVPPPNPFAPSALTLVPTALYDINVTRSNESVPVNGTVTYAANTRPLGADEENELEATEGRLRVHLRAGLDHASDVPLAVIREHLELSENIELVDEGSVYDVLVEVETMKLSPSATVFVVINAYKSVANESLIFYNTFGYLGEQKVLSGSNGYATNLEAALQQEASRIQD